MLTKRTTGRQSRILVDIQGYYWYILSTSSIEMVGVQRLLLPDRPSNAFHECFRQHTIWACNPSAKCKPHLISVVSAFYLPGLLNNTNFSTLMFKRLKKSENLNSAKSTCFQLKNTIEKIFIESQHHSAKKTSLAS